MQEIRDVYNGDIVVPLPEMDSREKPFVANLVAEGIDQQSMRIASTMPDVRCAPTREGFRNAEMQARLRRNAYLSWWDANRMNRKLRRRARYLTAYGSTSAFIRPDFKRGIPVWEIESPLGVYPASSSDPDELTPTDVIFSFSRSWGWIKQQYPEAAMKMIPTFGGNEPSNNDIWELLRYVDAEEIVLIAVRSHRESMGDSNQKSPASVWLTLHRLPNRAGICTATVAGRVTLDRLQGAFNQLIGMYQAQAKLMALETIAVEKAIFPDIVIYGAQGETPRLVSGWHDGRTGKANVIAGGQAQLLQSQPGFQTQPMVDRLERNQRVQGGIPAQFSGEVPTNLRTGRAGALTLSAQIDFRIQENQETLESVLEEENIRAAKVMKAYFGPQKTTFILNLGDRQVSDSYVPNDLFVTEANRVVYAMAGADANGLVVGIGQRIGVGTMSKKTGRRLDPFIEDADLEEEYVNYEDLERIAKQAFEQQAASGSVPLVDVARIMQLVTQDKKPLVEALVVAQNEAQARQAQQVPPTAPEAQPGLALPGQGAEAQVASVQAPPSSVGNLASLMGDLRKKLPAGP